MKKLISFGLVAAFVALSATMFAALPADQVLNAALAKAKIQNKAVFIDIGSPG